MTDPRHLFNLMLCDSLLPTALSVIPYLRAFVLLLPLPRNAFPGVSLGLFPTLLQVFVSMSPSQQVPLEDLI